MVRPYIDCRSRPRAPYRRRTDHRTCYNHFRHVGAAQDEPVGPGNDANIDLHQHVLHTLEEVEIGRSRSRDTHAAASRNKLQPVGSWPKSPSPIICSTCPRRCMTSSCHFSAAASARRAHRCVQYDQGIRVLASSIKCARGTQSERARAQPATMPQPGRGARWRSQTKARLTDQGVHGFAWDLLSALQRGAVQC